MDKAIEVLILIDVYGWAFDFVSRGIVKHSDAFNYEVKCWNEVNSGDKRFDVVFAFDYDTWNYTGGHRMWLGKARKCIGIRTNPPDPRLIEEAPQFHAVGCNSLKTYNLLKGKYPNADNIYFTPNGVDTDIFQPAPRSGETFKLGWAGSAERPCKRVHLARRLDYPVRVMCRRWGKYFVKGASRKHMQKFYAKIDCLVHTSNREGMTSVAIEAASCGLPIVATDVGDMAQLVEAEWLVPVEPEDAVVQEMNKRLEILKNDVELRHRVGERNRREVLDNWDWRHRVAGYEDMFRGALGNEGLSHRGSGLYRPTPHRGDGQSGL